MHVRRVGFGFHAIATLALIAFGWTYLSSSEFMSYHAAAVGMDWQELSPGLQVVGLTALRLVGAGSLALGLALGVILWGPYRRDEPWALWTVSILGSGYGLALSIAAFSVARATPGNPPWGSAGVLPLLFVMGGILSLVPVPDAREPGVQDGGTP